MCPSNLTRARAFARMRHAADSTTSRCRSATLEEYHSATLLAFAKYYCSVEQPTRVAIAGVDARGFILSVTTADGKVLDDQLAAFPRPITSASDAHSLAMEMHETAFAALGLRFKLQSRYFSEPAVVACRMAYRKSLHTRCSPPRRRLQLQPSPRC